MATLLDLGRRGVIGLVQRQLIGTLAGVAFAVAALVVVSPVAGLLSALRPVAIVVPMASLVVLVKSVGIETRPPGSPYRSGWPNEGVLLFGAAVIFTLSTLGAFVGLTTLGATDVAVLQMFVGMLVLGNALLGLAAISSYRQRERT